MEDSFYIAYVEDLYEDEEGEKMVKVRWFDRGEEASYVSHVHPKEVIMTPRVQVVSAECIDGVAVVLTPKHYDACLAIITEEFSDGIFMCSRQINKNNKVSAYPIDKLCGYSRQPALSLLNANNQVMSLTQEEEQEEQREQPESSTWVDQFVEVYSNDSGIRGCWFRCQILKKDLKKKLFRVEYMDVEDVEDVEDAAEGPGNLLSDNVIFRRVARCKLGMRCSGRLNVRPFPPPGSSSMEPNFIVGAAVEAWWFNAWWEGVVVGCRENDFHVYFPDENKFEYFEKNDLRSARDWVDNRWVEIRPKLDILSVVSPPGPSNRKTSNLMSSRKCKV